MEQSTVLTWLQGRHWIYSLLATVYYQGPTEELLANFPKEEALQEFARRLGNSLVQEGVTELYREWNARREERDYPGDLWADYNRLFVGPGKLLAPPWESVYRSKERLVFGESTLQVRSFYQRYGVEVKNRNKEPDDHVGLEMEFMAYLCQEALEKIRAGADAFPYIQASQQFLEEHLGQWVPEFCGDVEEGAKTGFFRGVAKFTRGWLECDREAVLECLEAMEDL